MGSKGRQSVVPRYLLSGKQIKRIVAPEMILFHGITEPESYYSTPELTQHELAGMLKAAAPETVMLLLCMYGVLSTQALRDFLIDHGFSHLVVDNSGQVEECLANKRDLGIFLDIMSSESVSTWKFGMECSWSDFLALSSTSLRGSEVEYRIVDGINTWRFIKSVGIGNVNRYGEEILGLEDRYTPDQIKLMIRRLEEPFFYPPHYSITFTKREQLSSVIKAANLIGLEAAVAMKMPILVQILTDFKGDINQVEHFRFIEEFLLAVKVTDSRGPHYRKIFSYYTLGLSVDDALLFSSLGIDPQRASEARDRGVTAPVAGGWL